MLTRKHFQFELQDKIELNSAVCTALHLFEPLGKDGKYYYAIDGLLTKSVLLMSSELNKGKEKTTEQQRNEV